jgi:hypothetical protein
MPKNPRRRSANLLERFSETITRWTGGSLAFGLACLVILTWAV